MKTQPQNPYNVLHGQASSSIIIIGAGGIVRTAHLPAYHLAGFSVKGIYDRDTIKAKEVAMQFHIPKVYNTLTDLLQDLDKDTVIDIAVPASGTIGLLQQLPDGVSVLMQKPMGETLQQAKEILRLCQEKKNERGRKFSIAICTIHHRGKENDRSGAFGGIVRYRSKCERLYALASLGFSFFT